MANIGDTKYVEYVVDRVQARDIRDTANQCASDISRAAWGLSVITKLLGAPNTFSVIPIAGNFLAADFKILADVYGRAYDLMASGRFVKAIVAQEFIFKGAKYWGDYEYDWFATGRPKIVSLQYANGRWETDPAYTG